MTPPVYQVKTGECIIITGGAVELLLDKTWKGMETKSYKTQNVFLLHVFKAFSDLRQRAR